MTEIERVKARAFLREIHNLAHESAIALEFENRAKLAERNVELLMTLASLAQNLLRSED
jgi:hypothetical protein